MWLLYMQESTILRSMSRQNELNALLSMCWWVHHRKAVLINATRPLSSAQLILTMTHKSQNRPYVLPTDSKEEKCRMICKNKKETSTVFSSVVPRVLHVDYSLFPLYSCYAHASPALLSLTFNCLI